ncbi:MAG: hypothetical protein ACP5RR_09990 [Candidatus Kapaibacteriota bacterium]
MKSFKNKIIVFNILFLLNLMNIFCQLEESNWLFPIDINRTLLISFNNPGLEPTLSLFKCSRYFPYYAITYIIRTISDKNGNLLFYDWDNTIGEYDYLIYDSSCKILKGNFVKEFPVYSSYLVNPFAVAVTFLPIKGKKDLFSLPFWGPPAPFQNFRFDLKGYFFNTIIDGRRKELIQEFLKNQISETDSLIPCMSSAFTKHSNKLDYWWLGNLFSYKTISDSIKTLQFVGLSARLFDGTKFGKYVYTFFPDTIDIVKYIDTVHTYNDLDRKFSFRTSKDGRRCVMPLPQKALQNYKVPEQYSKLPTANYILALALFNFNKTNGKFEYIGTLPFNVFDIIDTNDVDLNDIKMAFRDVDAEFSRSGDKLYICERMSYYLESKNIIRIEEVVYQYTWSNSIDSIIKSKVRVTPKGINILDTTWIKHYTQYSFPLIKAFAIYFHRAHLWSSFTTNFPSRYFFYGSPRLAINGKIYFANLLPKQTYDGLGKYNFFLSTLENPDSSAEKVSYVAFSKDSLTIVAPPDDDFDLIYKKFPIFIDDYSNIYLSLKGADTLCIGDTISLVAEIEQYPDSTVFEITGWKWEGPNGFISNEKELKIFAFSPKQSGYYRFTLFVNGTVVEDSIFVLVKEVNPKIITFPKEKLCIGDSLELKVSDEYLKYRWSTGDTTRSIFVKDTGKYWVEVEDSAGCKGIAQIEVKNYNIQFSGISEIDFGEVEIGKDKTELVNLVNNSDDNVTISKVYSKNGIYDIRPLVPLPKELNKGESFEFEVKYQPRELGKEDDDSIIIEVEVPCKVDWIIKVKGKGFSILKVWLPDTFATIGTKDFCIPLWSLNSSQNEVEYDYTAVLELDWRAMEPKGVFHKKEDDKWVITLERKSVKTGKQQSKIGEFCGDIYLPDKNVVPLIIKEFTTSNNYIKIEKDNGSLKIIGICVPDLSRVELFNKTELRILKEIVEETLALEILAPEGGKAEILSIEGSIVDLIEIKSSRDVQNIVYNTSRLGNGVYFIRFGSTCAMFIKIN